MLEESGLSRESVREGLRLLEVQGLITIRRGPGGGPVVGHLDPASLGRTSTLYYHLAGGTYAELLEAWVVTEVMLAERAARHPDRDRVRADMEPYLATVQDGNGELTDFVLGHTQFHGVLASLAENRVLEMLLQTIGQIVTHHVLGHADPRHDREMIEADHVAIAKAVVAGVAATSEQGHGEAHQHDDRRLQGAPRSPARRVHRLALAAPVIHHDDMELSVEEFRAAAAAWLKDHAEPRPVVSGSGGAALTTSRSSTT